MQPRDRELMKEGLEQLAEKQVQDSDRMLEKRMGVESSDLLEQDNDNTFADLFSGMPSNQEDIISPEKDEE